MMQRWHRFWQLSGYQRGLALEAGGGLLATWVGLRLAGFRRWKNVLAWLGPSLSNLRAAGGRITTASSGRDRAHGSGGGAEFFL